MAFDDRLRDAFLAVAQHGSIGRAADALNITQPALSRVIKRLEQRLGVALFDRYASGVTLTVYGEALLPFANRMGTESSHAVEEIERLRGGSRGVLRIGTVGSPGVTFLPKIIERMTTENPELRVELLEGVLDVLEAALLDRVVDIVLAGELAEKDEILRMNFKIEDTGSVIASTSHPVRARGPLTMADLIDVPWVMPPRGTFPRRRFEQVIADIGMRQPHVAVETRSVMMMKGLVAESGFLSWLPRPLYAAEERADLIAPLDVAGMFVNRQAYLYRRRHGSTPPVAVRFLETVRAMYG
ncbi:MAG: transcriptional regulator, LysR family [Sphingomonas bacterium]|nr:transcriptional regulator, LysR family [Sphingomonas bacterium]